MAEIHKLLEEHGKAGVLALDVDRRVVEAAAGYLASEEGEVGFLYSGWAQSALPHKRLSDDASWQVPAIRRERLCSPRPRSETAGDTVGRQERRDRCEPASLHRPQAFCGAGHSEPSRCKESQPRLLRRPSNPQQLPRRGDRRRARALPASRAAQVAYGSPPLPAPCSMHTWNTDGRRRVLEGWTVLG